MEQPIDNMQKYFNYREQLGRLNKALKAGFYLEAIFIEYSVMEDRLESVLRHSGKWNPKPGTHISIDRKITQVQKLTEEKRSIARQYFPEELLTQLRAWKEKRNKLIHALLKQNLHAQELADVAEEGNLLAKTLRTKVSAYNRALEKREQKDGN